MPRWRGWKSSWAHGYVAVEARETLVCRDRWLLLFRYRLKRLKSPV